MTKEFKISILRSIFFSGAASVISYLLIIFIVRMYTKESVSNYLYIVTCGMLFALILDLAAEQSLVHYSKTKNINILRLWKNLCLYKIFVIFVLLFLSFIWEIYSNSDVPQIVILMMIPAFYMGPVFEYYGLNSKYAQILLGEKLLVFIGVIIASTITKEIYSVIYIYFIVSVFSIIFQMSITRYLAVEEFSESRSSILLTMVIYTFQFI